MNTNIVNNEGNSHGRYQLVMALLLRLLWGLLLVVVMVVV